MSPRNLPNTQGVETHGDLTPDALRDLCAPCPLAWPPSARLPLLGLPHLPGGTEKRLRAGQAEGAGAEQRPGQGVSQAPSRCPLTGRPLVEPEFGFLTHFLFAEPRLAPPWKWPGHPRLAPSVRVSEAAAQVRRRWCLVREETPHLVPARPRAALGQGLCGCHSAERVHAPPLPWLCPPARPQPSAPVL